jgi:transposase
MRAYCQDLRERVVAFVDEGNLVGDAVETFHVSPSFVQWLLRRRDATGQFAAKPHGGGNPGSFSPENLACLARLSAEHPDAYLAELADLLHAAGGPRVHPSTVCKRLKALGITRKKKVYVPQSKTHRRFKRSARSSANRSATSTPAS